MIKNRTKASFEIFISCDLSGVQISNFCQFDIYPIPLINGLKGITDNLAFLQNRYPIKSDVFIENYKAELLKVFCTFHTYYFGDQ